VGRDVKEAGPRASRAAHTLIMFGLNYRGASKRRKIRKPL